jgi:hypothetical protein
MVLVPGDILLDLDGEVDEAVLTLVNTLQVEAPLLGAGRTLPIHEGYVQVIRHRGLFPLNSGHASWDAELFLFLHFCNTHGCTLVTCRRCS